MVTSVALTAAALLGNLTLAELYCLSSLLLLCPSLSSIIVSPEFPPFTSGTVSSHMAQLTFFSPFSLV